MYKIYHKKFGKTLLNLAQSVQSWLISALSVDIFILFINVNLFAFLMHDDFTATILSYYLFSFKKDTYNMAHVVRHSLNGMWLQTMIDPNPNNHLMN